MGHKYGYTTQIQFFRDRLESDKIGVILFPILVGLVIPYLLIGVMASGSVINSITEGAFGRRCELRPGDTVVGITSNLYRRTDLCVLWYAWRGDGPRSDYGVHGPWPDHILHHLQ